MDRLKFGVEMVDKKDVAKGWSDPKQARQDAYAPLPKNAEFELTTS